MTAPTSWAQVFSMLLPGGVLAWAMKPFFLSLGALLLVDLVFVFAYLLWATNTAVDFLGWHINLGQKQHVSFTKDHGYAEKWEGIKGLFTAACFVGCYLHSRQLIYTGLAAIFMLPHADNYFRFHERVGGYLSAMGGQDGLSLTAHMGQLAAFICIGVAALVIFTLTYRQSDASARQVGLIALLIMALLAIFAAGIDLAEGLASIVFNVPRWTDIVLGLVEDGGEMMTISLGLAFSWATYCVLRATNTRRVPLLPS